MTLILTNGVRVAIRPPVSRVTVVPVSGPTGPTGPAGAPEYAHHQTAAAATWTIAHGLNKRIGQPTILLDSAPNVPVLTDVAVLDANTIALTFPTPVTGWAYLH